MRNSFKWLLLSSILLGGTLLHSTLDSVHAMFNAIFGFWGKCRGGYIFLNGNIPWIVYVLITFTTAVIGLFFGTLIHVARKTKTMVKAMQSQMVNHDSQVIIRYSLAKQIPVQVFKNSRPIACCFGFHQPRILVSTALIDLLQDDELLAVLEHEYHHCKKRDPLKMLFAFGIARAFFFIPVLRSLCDRYLLYKELVPLQATLILFCSFKMAS